MKESNGSYGVNKVLAIALISALGVIATMAVAMHVSATNRITTLETATADRDREVEARVDVLERVHIADSIRWIQALEILTRLDKDNRAKR